MNNMFGFTQEQKESYATICIPDSIYRLTLAWVTSENSTKQLECRLILTRLSAPVSGVLCRLPLSVVPRQLLVSSFVQPTLFSRPLPLPDPPRFQVQNPLSGFTPKQTKESSAWRATYIVLQQQHRHNEESHLIYGPLASFS